MELKCHAETKVASPQELGVPASMLRKSIPTHMKQTVWRRAGSRCEFIATTGPCVGKRCLSHFRLEIDHRLSVAAGGTNELTNLQLLCASHHRDKTKKEFPTFRLPKAG